MNISSISCPIPQQYGEAQRHLEAHQGDPSFLLALAYVLAQTTPDQVRCMGGDEGREVPVNRLEACGTLRKI